MILCDSYQLKNSQGSKQIILIQTICLFREIFFFSKNTRRPTLESLSSAAQHCAMRWSNEYFIVVFFLRFILHKSQRKQHVTLHRKETNSPTLLTTHVMWMSHLSIGKNKGLACLIITQLAYKVYSSFRLDFNFYKSPCLCLRSFACI